MDEQPVSSDLPTEPKSTETISDVTRPVPASTTNPAESFTPSTLPPSTAIPEPAKPKKRRLKKALMIAIIAVATFGVGAFAYLGVYVPNQPENVVKIALGNLLAADSANLRGSAVLNWSNFTVNPVFNAEVAQDGGAAFGLQANLGGVDMSLDVSQTADDVYFRVGGLSGFGDSWQDMLVAYGFGEQQISAVNDLIVSIEDKWIVLNDVVQPGQNGLPSVDPAQLSTAFSERDIVSSAEKVGEETIESRTASHFKVTFNKDEIKAGIDTLSLEGLTAEHKTQLKSALDELELTDIDLWVYNDTKEFAKVTHDGNLGSGEQEGAYQLEIIFVSFNQSASVETPPDAISGSELWLDLNNSLQLDQLYQETLNSIPTDSLEIF